MNDSGRAESGLNALMESNFETLLTIKEVAWNINFLLGELVRENTALEVPIKIWKQKKKKKTWNPKRFFFVFLLPKSVQALVSVMIGLDEFVTSRNIASFPKATERIVRLAFWKMFRALTAPVNPKSKGFGKFTAVYFQVEKVKLINCAPVEIQ